MNHPTEEVLARLAARHSPTVVERYRGRLEGSDPFFEPAPKDEASREFLEELAAEGYLEAHDRWLCPDCREVIRDLDKSEKRCSQCSFSFEHEEPELCRVYSRPGRRSRDPRWVVTVHGMNTRGPWQEEFSWKLAQLYGYAVPVAIYKYGKLLISPFLLVSQERYARCLVNQLRKLRGEMTAGGYGDRPDVIAHSFGTWLLGRALRLDPELRVGRVVLTGSIVSPDFAWRDLLAGEAPRAEAVLCHYGGRDRTVSFAQFFIPHSGPSGRRGFNARDCDCGRLVHRFEPDFRHSDYFAPANLDRVMKGVWGPFLTLPEEDLATWANQAGSRPASPWRRSRLGLLTHPLKYCILASLALLALVLAAALILGLCDLVGLL